METRYLKKWEGFGEAIANVRKQYGVHVRDDGQYGISRRPVHILYRGMSDASWPLETTLERKTNKRFDILSYAHLAARNVHEITSVTGKVWNVDSYPEIEKFVASQDALRPQLPCYDYLVYLRHHGFPSPLLDWTTSPYVAAYFAYHSAGSKPCAVYCYIERPQSMKSGSSKEARINVMGPFVTTHRRHFAQKATYTIATRWDIEQKANYFCPHEEVFALGREDQDVLVKLVLPSRTRTDGLRALDEMNINHFTLFQSEDSLITALASREFDLLPAPELPIPKKVGKRKA